MKRTKTARRKTKPKARRRPGAPFARWWAEDIEKVQKQLEEIGTVIRASLAAAITQRLLDPTHLAAVLPGKDIKAIGRIVEAIDGVPDPVKPGASPVVKEPA